MKTNRFNTVVTAVFTAVFAVCTVTVLVPAAQAASWDGGGTDDDWSTADNWSDNAAPNGNISFDANTDGAGSAATVTSIVDTDYSVGTLSYVARSGSYHHTQIDDGVTLEVTGFLHTYPATSGTGATTISGAGHLTYNNSGGVFDVRGGHGNNNRSILDMSDLATFTATASRIDIGQEQNKPAALVLADTNSITAGELRVGYWDARSELHMGGSNTLNINTFRLVDGAYSGGALNTAVSTVKFDTGLTDPTVTIRNAAGTGAADLNMAWDMNGGASWISSTLDLRGGEVDARFDDVRMGSNRPLTTGGISGSANFYFDEGSVSMADATLAWNRGPNSSGTANGRIYVSGTGELTVDTLNLVDNDGGNGSANGIVFLQSDDASFRATTIQDAGTHASNESKMIRRIQIEGGTFGNIGGTDLTVSSEVGILLAGSGTRTIDITAGQTGTINGVIGEDAAGKGFTKTGDGTLILNATNTYTGVTTLAGGEIHVLESVLDVAAAQAAIANGSFAPSSLVVTDIGTHTRIALPPPGTVVFIR